MKVKYAVSPAASAPVEALIVGLADTPDGPAWAQCAGLQWPSGTAAALLARTRAVQGKAAPGSVTRIPAGDLITAPLLLAVGLGTAPASAETVRRAIGDALRGLRAAGAVAVALPTPDGDPAPLIEGLLLGDYRFDAFRSAAPHPRPKTGLVLLGRKPGTAERRTVDEATIVATAVHHARDLVNTPPGHLRPSDFVERAGELLAGSGAALAVLDERALRRKGFGGILGVGQGSSDAPRLLRVTHRHPKAKKSVALVGKGITFDSGGLSLKTAKGMEWMKADMAGAAAVVAAVSAIARIGLPVNVTAWAPLAENMPSGTAQRPGDILTMYGGKTVEVLNTDAEGRLVLGDALVRAAEDEPDLLIDIATLTGAQIVALGPRVSGLMGNNPAVRTAVHEAAEAVGEQMWPMPLPKELRANLDSPVADIANVGGPDGGMLTAGLFLAEFVDPQTPWVHLDIAGPAYNNAAAFGYTPKGGTGAGVRTLVEVARRVAAGTLPLDPAP